MLAGGMGTPAWPKFQSFLTGSELHFHGGALFESEGLQLMLLATAVVAAGFWAGWRLYGQKPPLQADQADPLAGLIPGIFGFLRQNGRVDELYARTVLRANAGCAAACDWLDRGGWGNLVLAVAYLVWGLDGWTGFATSGW